MNILGTQYTLNTKSFEIYISGCNGNPHCKGCHNPESWDFDLGKKFNKDYENQIAEKIQQFDSLINNIMIFGGEPNDQNLDDLKSLLNFLIKFNKDIWLFTRYSIEDVPKFEKDICSYIKCGRYIESLKTEDNIQYGIKLATSNQKIYKKGKDY